MLLFTEVFSNVAATLWYTRLTSILALIVKNIVAWHFSARGDFRNSVACESESWDLGFEEYIIFYDMYKHGNKPSKWKIERNIPLRCTRIQSITIIIYNLHTMLYKHIILKIGRHFLRLVRANVLIYFHILLLLLQWL